MSTEYTLTELAELTGEPVRRIRSYIQQDLLPRPTTAGRNASYPDRSLNRLLAIKHLRAGEGLSIGEVRQALANLGEQEISELAEASSDVSMTTVEPSYRRSSGRGSDGDGSRAGSALQYLESLRSSPGNARSRSESPRQTKLNRSRNAQFRESRLSSDPAGVDPSTRHRLNPTARQFESGVPQQRKVSSESALRKLLARLNEVAPSTRIKRRARSEEWIKIPITPDMELHVRKEFGDYDQAALEILADYIREALAGGI